MESNASGSSSTPTTGASKRRKPRASRGRGLRTTAGCLTCRQRRLKCDEGKPDCGQCTKSSRACLYASAKDQQLHPAQSIQANRPPNSDGELASPSRQPHSAPEHQQNATLKLSELLENATPGPTTSEVGSPLTTSTSLTTGAAPHYWYDLIAQDAVKNVDNYNFLANSGARWSFGSSSVHPTDSPVPVFQHSPKTSISTIPIRVDQPPGDSTPSYNTSEPPVLREHELKYLQHYLDVVAPILDLFDPQQHFRTHVLHLALRNVGLLKSVLALSAAYKARCSNWDSLVASNEVPGANGAGQPMADGDMAVQYYYESLNYLSKAMQYPGYPHSQEILANAALISWYEAFDTEASTNWERHLKGVFWIQRSQDTNGETTGLRKAVWWNWLRQDIWAAFRQGRRTLTIWRPTKTIDELDSEDLACRALYLQAKAVGYASDEIRQNLEFNERIEEGNVLLDALEDWHNCLPRIFRPLPSPSDLVDTVLFPPIWIHPPIFAAGMQAYYSAKILILLNRPSLGGRQEYHEIQKALDDCVAKICGIAQGPNALDVPLAFVNSQALFFGKFCQQFFVWMLSTAAGQCVRTTEQQEVLLDLLDKTLDTTKFPSKGLLDELRLLWSKS
jgi:hypothetical protein